MQRVGWARCGLPIFRTAWCSSRQRCSTLVGSSSCVLRSRHSASFTSGADSNAFSSIDAPVVPPPLFFAAPSTTTPMTGMKFGTINTAFHNHKLKNFYTIHGGSLHKGTVPLAKARKPLYVESASVFGAMIDIPAHPLSPAEGAVQMWDEMRPLESFRMESVKRKRGRKMNRHKHRKLLKKTRFLRRKLKQA